MKLIRDGEKGVCGGAGGGGGDYIPIATLNDSCIKMGSDESHFNK